MGFVGCIPRFLKAHAGWVLTALGSAGLIGTAVLIAKEAPEVQEELLNTYLEKSSEMCGRCGEDAVCTDDGCPAQLTFWEKTKVVVPIYLPAILMGTGTLACFWGAQIFNARKQAALIAAYGALAMQFDQYREAIKAEYGDEADKKALTISQMEVKRLQAELKKLKEECGPQLYTFDTLPGVIFEAKPEQVINGLAHFNRNLIMGGANCLSEAYTFCGIPEQLFDKKLADNYGWQEYENQIDFEIGYVDFHIFPVQNKFLGRSVNVIKPVIPPYEVNIDYGFEGDISTHEYPDYDPNAAENLAKQADSEDDIYKVDPNHMAYAPITWFRF